MVCTRYESSTNVWPYKVIKVDVSEYMFVCYVYVPIRDRSLFTWRGATKWFF